VKQTLIQHFLMKRYITLLALGLACAILVAGYGVASAQESRALTPLQREIEKQRVLLASSDVEARRDALIRLGNLHRAASSRVAATGLTDPLPIIRATAAHSILSLPVDEAIAGLLPLLNDKQEFVRQQVAYALGETHSDRAVAALANIMAGDKENSVRGAAAVALGEIGDAAAVLSLTAILDPGGAAAIPGKKQKAKSKTENEFVARAAARSLGQIGSRQGVASLTRVLAEEINPGDLRREAATALGLIGDSAAVPALRSVLGSEDPHLARTAQEALERIARRSNRQGM
jgi:HEAT repeat protein